MIPLWLTIQKPDDPLFNGCTLYFNRLQKLHDLSLIVDVQIRSNYGDSKRSADFFQYIPFYSRNPWMSLYVYLIRIISINLSWEAYNSDLHNILNILVRTFSDPSDCMELDHWLIGMLIQSYPRMWMIRIVSDLKKPKANKPKYWV
jgi:hypothetical protein